MNTLILFLCYLLHFCESKLSCFLNIYTITTITVKKVKYFGYTLIYPFFLTALVCFSYTGIIVPGYHF